MGILLTPNTPEADIHNADAFQALGPESPQSTDCARIVPFQDLGDSGLAHFWRNDFDLQQRRVTEHLFARKSVIDQIVNDIRKGSFAVIGRGNRLEHLDSPDVGFIPEMSIGIEGNEICTLPYMHKGGH